MNKNKTQEGRRVGNTTRQIDDAIQRLFTEGSIEIPIDHSLERVANHSLYKRLVNRLHLEHEGMWGVDENKIYAKSKDKPRAYIAIKSVHSNRGEIGGLAITTVLKKGDIYLSEGGYIKDRLGDSRSVEYLILHGYLEERKNEE